MSQLDPMFGNQYVSNLADMERADEAMRREAEYGAAHNRLCQMAMVPDVSAESALRAMKEYRVARTAYALARLERERPPRV